MSQDCACKLYSTSSFVRCSKRDGEQKFSRQLLSFSYPQSGQRWAEVRSSIFRRLQQQNRRQYFIEAEMEFGKMRQLGWAREGDLKLRTFENLLMCDFGQQMATLLREHCIGYTCAVFTRLSTVLVLWFKQCRGLSRSWIVKAEVSEGPSGVAKKKIVDIASISMPISLQSNNVRQTRHNEYHTQSDLINI